jgi:hypothetical protein
MKWKIASSDAIWAQPKSHHTHFENDDMTKPQDRPTPERYVVQVKANSS